MLSRFSVAGLLKSVVGLAGIAVVMMVATSAWDSWERLAVTGRIAAIADGAGYAFTAMHNLRTDRSSTVRNLNGADPIDAEAEKYLRRIRDAEVPALKSALAVLETVDFPDRSTLLLTLQRSVKTLTALQSES